MNKSGLNMFRGDSHGQEGSQVNRLVHVSKGVSYVGMATGRGSHLATYGPVQTCSLTDTHRQTDRMTESNTDMAENIIFPQLHY